MEKIYYKNTLVGLRVKKFSNGVKPISDKNEPLQLLTLKEKKGVSVKPHIHVPKKRVNSYLHECLIVRKGKIRIDIYSLEKKFLKRIVLNEGSLFILMSGGWSVTFLEDSEIFEIKNGPFLEDRVDI